MKLYIMRGCSGSGKSTLAQELGGTICSADNYFMRDGEYQFDPKKLGAAHNYCRVKAVFALKSKTPTVVIDNTNCTLKELFTYYDAGTHYGYEVVICQVSNANPQNVHGVPPETIQKQLHRIKMAPIPKDWTVKVVNYYVDPENLVMSYTCDDLGLKEEGSMLTALREAV